MMRIPRLHTLVPALATAALLVAGCGSNSSGSAGSSAAPAADVALSVNGTTVPMALYTDLVSATQQRIEETTGVPIDAKTAAGQARIADIERTAMKDLVRDSVIAQLAAQRNITVSDADLDTALKGVATGLGGQSSLSASIDQSRFDPATFRTLYRYVVLLQRLRAADSGIDAEVDAAVGRATVLAYAAPCNGATHTYPACAGS